jgi:hypothetical protein
MAKKAKFTDVCSLNRDIEVRCSQKTEKMLSLSVCEVLR